MQFDSVKDALDHLLSFAGQDGDEAAVYITESIINLGYCLVDLRSKIEASDRIIAGLRAKLAAAEHEIAVLNRMVCFETCVSLNCLESDLHCGSPECLALLRTEAERQLKEKAQ